MFSEQGDFVDEQIKDTPDEFANSPAADPAEKILRDDSDLFNEDREELWNLYHLSKTPDELAQYLHPLENVSNDTKHQLFMAKKRTAPEPTPLDRTQRAIQSVAQMDPDTLRIAESHPVVLKALVDAVMPKSKAKA